MSVFGPETSVKLDVFHAVQRMTRTLPKRHSLFHKCLSKFRAVFREDGDSGEKRISDTPPPEKMMKNFNDFYKEWKDATDSTGTKLLTSASAKAASNLQTHIAASCLSGIPPGKGTNRNERFHHLLKSFFHKNRVGISLAYALLSVLMYSHNVQTGLCGKKVVRPISASRFQGTSPTSSMRPMGIVPKVVQHRDQGDEIDITQRRVDMNFVVRVYSRSVQKLMILMTLKQMSLDEMVKDINSFQPFCTFSDVDDPDQTHNIQQRLNDYGLVISPSPKDGNCFFHSVATCISFSSNLWDSTLKRLGISYCTSEDLQAKLRQVFVHEILENQLKYDDFINLNSDAYRMEAMKFLDSGYYNSQLEDLMPLAMANVLQAHVILLRTDTNIPWYITPDFDTLDKTIILVYYASGPGHYDSAVPFTWSHRTSADEKITKCNCGVNKKGCEAKACCPQPRYATRCVCYRIGKSCSSLCRCKNCGNPNGPRIVLPVGYKNKRKRRPHEFQKDLPKSKKFALERGESVSEQIWSTFECIVLNNILIATSERDYATILKHYNDIVFYSTTPFCTFFLPENVVFREKRSVQIRAKLEHISVNTQ